jgi:nucleotide-binding universal stress UspA family protein
MFRKILVAVNDLSEDKSVFDAAIAVAKADNAALMLLHVLTPFDQNYPTSIYPGVDGVYIGLHEEALQVYMDQWKQFEQKGLEMLRSLASEARAQGLEVEFSQNLGDAGRTICAIAQTWQADLIVLGRHGRKGLSELFLGSVSNYVLHHAPCSVLTVQGGTPAKTVEELGEAIAHSA